MMKNDNTNWLAISLIFIGTFVVSIAIGQIVNDAAWAGIGIGVGIMLVGVFHFLSNRK